MDVLWSRSYRFVGHLHSGTHVRSRKQQKGRPRDWSRPFGWEGRTCYPSRVRIVLTSFHAPLRSVLALTMLVRALFRSAWLPGQPDGTRLMTEALTPEIEVCDAVTLPVSVVKSACASALTVADTVEVVMRFCSSGITVVNALSTLPMPSAAMTSWIFGSS